MLAIPFLPANQLKRISQKNTHSKELPKNGKGNDECEFTHQPNLKHNRNIFGVGRKIITNTFRKIKFSKIFFCSFVK